MGDGDVGERVAGLHDVLIGRGRLFGLLGLRLGLLLLAGLRVVGGGHGLGLVGLRSLCCCRLGLGLGVVGRGRRLGGGLGFVVAAEQTAGERQGCGEEGHEARTTKHARVCQIWSGSLPCPHPAEITVARRRLCGWGHSRASCWPAPDRGEAGGGGEERVKQGCGPFAAVEELQDFELDSGEGGVTAEQPDGQAEADGFGGVGSLKQDGSDQAEQEKRR